MRFFNLANRLLIENSMKRLVLLCSMLLITSCEKDHFNQFSTKIAPLGELPADSILWSPTDQNKIIVSTGYADFSEKEVYLLNIETKKKNIVVQTERGILSAKAWSPDGKQIILSAFQDTIGFEQGGLWKLNVEDNSIMYFRNEPSNIIWGTDTDTQFIFDKARKTESGKLFTDIVRFDSETHQEFVIFSVEPDQLILGFSLSPDGKQLVLAMGNSEPPMNNFDLYILNIPSGEIEKITHGGDNKYPVWSNTDELIAYINKVYDNGKAVYSIYLVNPITLCQAKLLEADLLLSPSWSPDDNFLAYIEQGDVYIANLREFLTKNNSLNSC